MEEQLNMDVRCVIIKFVSYARMREVDESGYNEENHQVGKCPRGACNTTTITIAKQMQMI